MKKFGCLASAALALVLTGAPAMAGPPAKEVLATQTGILLGPLAFDASLEDVKRALPAAGWKDTEVSPFTGRVFGVAAKDALEIGGRRFNVGLAHYYYSRSLALSGGFDARAAADCDQAAIEWLTALEPMVGPFKGGEPRRTGGSDGGVDWTSARQPNGGVIVTPTPRIGTPARLIDEPVKFGAASTALATAYDDENKNIRRNKFANRNIIYYSLEAHSERGGAYIRANADYDKFADTCKLTLAVSAGGAMPAPAYFEFHESKIATAPTLAERRFIQSLFGAPATPTTFVFDCYLSRMTGAPEACKSVDGPKDAHAAERLARAIAEAHSLALDSIDRDDSANLRVKFPVSLGPTDPAPGSLAARPRTPRSDVTFVAEPNEEDLARAHSHVRNAATESVSVEAVCEALADGSAYCESAAPDGAAETTAFARAAEEALLALRVAPKLKNGKPSAGAVFDIAITLAPSETDPADEDAAICALFPAPFCANRAPQAPEGE